MLKLLGLKQQKGPDCSGPFVWVRCECGLEGAKLEVQLGAGHKELVVLITATPRHEHRRAATASSRNRADEGAVVLLIEVHPQTLNAKGQVISEGVFRARAQHPAGAHIVVVN